MAVISDRLWRTRYGADPAIIGRQLSFNDTPYQILGVMPARFHYPDDVDVWQRLRWDMTQHSRHAHFMEGVARLTAAATLEQAQAASDALAARLASDFPESNKAWGVRLTPVLEDRLGYYRPALVVLFGAVALLLVIGCLNVASLMLTRALSREKEIAVRIAMGASPRQLVTQLLSEGLVISTAGALARRARRRRRGAPRREPHAGADPRLEEATLRFGALGIGLGVVIATTLLFGLVPASLLVKRQLATDLKSGERGSSRGARWMYSTLVAGEVALACVLLVSSALLVRTVSRMMDTPIGVDADVVVITTLQLSDNAHADWSKVADTHAAVLDQIRSQSGIAHAGGTNFLPLEFGWRTPFGIEGVPTATRLEDRPQAQFHSVSDGYFETMGATLSAGRFFTAFDTARSAPVVVVNETFVRRFIPDRPPVGRVLTSDATGIGPLGANLLRRQPRGPDGSPHPRLPPTPYEVIGVVKDVRDVPLGQTIEPAIYFSTRQFPFREQFIVVRAADTRSAQNAIRSAIRDAAPGVPMADDPDVGIAICRTDRRAPTAHEHPRVLRKPRRPPCRRRRLRDVLVVVALRTRELAIRLALGAKPASIGGIILRQSAILALVGLVAGLGLIRIGEGALSRVLYQITPGDLAATVTASILLLGTALGACMAPARRAMRVDPVEGLRAE